jgi:hypothetical protein
MHAGGSSSCCACVVMQILKIKTAVSNILQTRPFSSLVLEPKMYVFCVWVGGGAQNGGELKSHRIAQVRVYRSRGSLAVPAI